MGGVTRLGKGIASLAAGVTGGIASLQPDEADAGIVVPFRAAKNIWESKAVDDVLKEIDEYGTFFGHPDRTVNFSVRARSDETWRQMEEHLTEKDFRDALQMRGQPWGSYNPAKPNDPFNQHGDEWLAARHYLRNLTEERQAANPLPPRENKVTVMSQADEAFRDGLDAPRKLTLDEKRAEYLKAQAKRKKDHELLNTPEKIEIEVQKQIDKRMEKDLNDMENANRLMWEASNSDIKWKPWSAAKRAEKKKELDFAEYEKGARQFVKSRELFSRPMSGGDEGYDSQRMRARGTRQQYLEETRDPEVRQKMAEENAEGEIMGDMFGDEAEWYQEDPEGFIPYTQAQREKELAKKMPEQIKKELKAIEDKRKEFQNYPPELLAAAPAAGIPPATLMAEIQQPDYGTREDGTAKGEGYLGLIPTGRGDEVMSEKSMGIEVDGKEVLIPLIVPTLNSNEIEFLKTYDGPVQGIPESIKRKAQDHAFKRMGAGQSPFAESGDVPDQVPGTRSSERQRIEDEYGLSTQAMLDRYQPSREPLADWEKLIDYRPEPNADRTHTVGYGTDDNAKAAEAYTDELKFGARYGLAEIPEQIPWVASMIADELPGAGYYQMATGQQLGDKMTEVEQNTHDYWAGKANTQGDDPSRTPEGLLPNMLRFGVGMGAETALVTAPFRVGRAVDQGVKSLRKGTAAAKAAPGTVDETRRAIVTGTPVAAATAGIAGLSGLKYMTKEAAPIAEKVLESVATTAAKDISGWPSVFAPIRQYIKGKRYEKIGASQLNSLDNIGPTANRFRSAADDLNFGRRAKNDAIRQIQFKFGNNKELQIEEDVLNQVLKNPKLKKEFIEFDQKAELEDYIWQVISGDPDELKALEKIGAIKFKGLDEIHEGYVIPDWEMTKATGKEWDDIYTKLEKAGFAKSDKYRGITDLFDDVKNKEDYNTIIRNAREVTRKKMSKQYQLQRDGVGRKPPPGQQDLPEKYRYLQKKEIDRVEPYNPMYDKKR